MPMHASLFRMFLCVVAALLAACASQGDKKSASTLPVPIPAANIPVTKKQPTQAGEITVVSLNHLFGLKQTGQVLLVDCRSALFYRMSHIDGAINLPTKKLDAELPSIKPQLDAAVLAGQIIVVYCQNEKCPYSYTAAKKLSEQGYTVTIYRGGWEEWKSAGFD